MNFTKSKLLKAVKSSVSHRSIFNAIFLEINKALVRKETVKISCFGTFYVSTSKVKYGQQFHTKERMTLKPQYRIRFIPSKTINKIVNQRNLIGEINAH